MVMEANGLDCGCGLKLMFPGLPSSYSTLGSLSWDSLGYLGWIVMVLIELWICVEHCVTKIVLLGLKGIPLTSYFIDTQRYVFNKGLFRVFHAILSVVGTTADFTWGSDFIHMGFFGVEVTKLTTGRLVNGLSCDGIEMDTVAEFCGPSWWKELSKESGSKILPYGDGSCWKSFKPVASLIA
ncbi:hypothetical protein Tco_1468600 [Tanacetum coccineum]